MIPAPAGQLDGGDGARPDVANASMVAAAQVDDACMTRDRTSDPEGRSRHAAGARFVPVAGLYGTEAIVPAPLDSGPPRPEPEERWTLGVAQHLERPPEDGADGDRAADDPQVTGIP